MNKTWHLSQREEQIVRLASVGLTDKEICERVSLCLTTVRTHWERIRVRLGASNRAQVIAMVTSRFTEEVARGWYERARAMQEALDAQEAIVYEICDRTLEVTPHSSAPAWLHAASVPATLRLLLNEEGLNQFVRAMREQRTAAASVQVKHFVRTRQGLVAANSVIRRVAQEPGSGFRFMVVTTPEHRTQVTPSNGETSTIREKASVL